MSRKLAMLGLLTCAGLGVAAIVHAQTGAAQKGSARPAATQKTAPPAEEESLSIAERLRKASSDVVGGITGADEPVESNAVTPLGKVNDWSAGRKAMGGQSRPNRYVESEAPTTQVPPAQRNPSAARPTNRVYTPQRAPEQNPTRRPQVTRLPTESPSPVISASATAPGEATASPVKNRLMALRDRKFDAAPATEEAPVAAKPTKIEPATPPAKATAAAADATERKPAESVIAAPTIAAPETDTPAAIRAANRYADAAKSPATNSTAATKTPHKEPEPASEIPPAKSIEKSAAANSAVLTVRTIGPQKVTIGKPATYQLVLENHGDAAANEVVVTCKLPPWAEVESATASAGAAPLPESDNSDGIQWRVPRLEATSKQTLALQIVPRQSTPFQLAVQWTFAPEATETIVEVQEPKLQIAVSGPNELMYGASDVFRITVSNPGTGDAENVTILTSSSPAATAAGGEPMDKLILGTLPAGRTKTLELKVSGTAAGNLLVRAQAAGDGGLAAETSQKVLVRRAALAVAAVGPETKYAGTPATYKIKLHNPGNAAAENVRIEVALPIGSKFESCSAGGASTGGKVEWTVPTLGPGAEQSVELSCIVMTAGVNRLQVNANAGADLTATAEVSTKVDALADLKLEISDPAGPVNLQEDAVYEIRIRNRGTKTAEGVRVVAFFSEGIEPISATGANHTRETGQVTFDAFPSVDPGQEFVCKITAKAVKAGTYVFRAELACDQPDTRLVAEETTLFYGQATANPEPQETSAATE